MTDETTASRTTPEPTPEPTPGPVPVPAPGPGGGRVDEAARRRTCFTPGAAVVMADGQEWVLPRPLVRFVPADDDVGYEVVVRLGDDGTFGALVRAMNEAETDGAYLRAALAAGKALLTANYDLAPAELRSLLQFGVDPEADPDGCRLRDEVIGVALGHGPKPPAGGGGSPPTPSG